MEACRVLAGQPFRDFELCISDDCSTDGRSAGIWRLRHRGVWHCLASTGCSLKNARYDKNLRTACQYG